VTLGDAISESPPYEDDLYEVTKKSVTICYLLPEIIDKAFPVPLVQRLYVAVKRLGEQILRMISAKGCQFTFP
jgi:hypothetical protein